MAGTIVDTISGIDTKTIPFTDKELVVDGVTVAGARGLVAERFSDAIKYSDDTWEVTKGYIESLGDYLKDESGASLGSVEYPEATRVTDLTQMPSPPETPEPREEPGFKDTFDGFDPVPDLNVPDAPENTCDTELNYEAPEKPTLPEYNAPVKNTSPPVYNAPTEPAGMPEYNAPTEPAAMPEYEAPEVPNVEWSPESIDAPDLVVFNPPEKKSINLGDPPVFLGLDTITAPSPLNLQQVDQPVLKDIDLPSRPDVDIPSFEGVAPTDVLLAPNPVWSFTESGDMDDCVYSSLCTKISGILDGSDALILSEETVSDIYSSAEEQLSTQLSADLEGVSEEWASKGYILPPGMMIGRLDEVRNKHSQNLSIVTKEIGIKQSELALDGIKAAMSTGVQLHDLILKAYNDIQLRAFESAKVAYTGAFQVFEAQVASYTAKADLYKAEASVYEVGVKALMYEVELFKAEIEGAKAQQEVNTSLVEMYKAQIEANLALAEIYKSEMQAFEIKSNTEAIKVEVFKAEMSAYASQINAETAKVGLYQGEVQAEATRMSINRDRVGVYQAQVQAEAEKGKVERVKSDIYSSQVQAEGEKAKYAGIATDIFSSQVQAEGEKAKYAGVAAEVYASSVKAEQVKAEYAALLVDYYAKDVQAEGVKAEFAQAEAALYSAQVNGEEAKARFLTVEAAKYRDEVAAWTQQAQIAMEKIRFTIDKNRSAAQSNLAKVSKFSEEVKSFATLTQQDLGVYEADGKMYNATAQIAIQDNQGKLEEYRSRVAKAETEGRILLEEAKINLEAAQKNHNRALEASKVGATVSAQLMASSLNMVNASASIGFDGSTSVRYSNSDTRNHSEGITESHSF